MWFIGRRGSKGPKNRVNLQKSMKSVIIQNCIFYQFFCFFFGFVQSFNSDRSMNEIKKSSAILCDPVRSSGILWNPLLSSICNPLQSCTILCNLLQAYAIICDRDSAVLYNPLWSSEILCDPLYFCVSRKLYSINIRIYIYLHMYT